MPLTKTNSAKSRRRSRPREAGFSLPFVIVAITLLTFGLLTALTPLGRAAILSRYHRNRAACEIAVADALGRPAPATDGGAIYPNLDPNAVDRVYVDPDDGVCHPLSGQIPDAAFAVERRWKLETTDGVRVFRVSGVLLDPDRLTPAGPLEVVAIRARSIR